MSTLIWCLSLHLLATLCMVGVIWFVQIVHYPMFKDVGGDAFQRYEAIHQARTTWIVMPLMLTELSTNLVLVAHSDLADQRWLTVPSLLLLVVIWGTTFWVSVPAHRELARGFADRPYLRLVRTNWIRTVSWTVRGALALLMLLAAVGR